ncbi:MULTISPECIES: putative allantoin permease [Vagococcus]|uniref:Allantoin permease n=1 Tax=Vagococcus fluvialis bH819 TaxID=1255619 RepID=A0A1X6WQR3_9ENTE|nr:MULTISPECIES: putative allantoin permease [Vagococcus]SLM86630.1 Allantoin permease [Vagococcus fluvialis bH819]HCM90838.1 putative allantoin permease [Vagococcus sp.]
MGEKRCIETDLEKQNKLLESRGYNQELLPKLKDDRDMGILNYFTLWMGSIHNIPNYAAVGGFLLLGLTPFNIMIALFISSLAVAMLMILNGKAGSKYGIPFSMHLRLTYGDVGAKLPGFLRGGVAAIAWLGLQNYTGSLALLILIGKIWPSFLLIGGDTNLLGISVPGLIAFTLFWGINLLIGLGGGAFLNKFTAILNPLIYIVFIGMAIWAIYVAKGFQNILSFRVTENIENGRSPIIIYLMIISSVLSVWAGPMASVSDFTQHAKSTKDQMIGQTLGLGLGYLIFAFSSMSILIGGSIYYGTEEWNVLNIVNKWDSLPAMLLAITVLLMTTISTNVTGNIVPAAYQLSALFPKQVNYKKGVWIASVLSFLIMPWKLMENSVSIFAFLNLIGSLLGPIAGVMLAQYLCVLREKIDLNQLYLDKTNPVENNPYKGINKPAYLATIIALLVSISGQFIRPFAFMSDFSFLVGSGCAFILYLLLSKFRLGGNLDEF